MGENDKNNNSYVLPQDNTRINVPVTFTPQGLPQDLYIGSVKSDPVLPFSKPSDFEQFVMNNYSENPIYSQFLDNQVNKRFQANREWFKKASGKVNIVSPEFDLLTAGKAGINQILLSPSSHQVKNFFKLKIKAPSVEDAAKQVVRDVTDVEGDIFSYPYIIDNFTDVVDINFIKKMNKLYNHNVTFSKNNKFEWLYEAMPDAYDFSKGFAKGLFMTDELRDFIKKYNNE